MSIARNMIIRISLCFLVACAISPSAFSQGVTHWRLENPFLSRCDAAFSFSTDHAALISGRQILFEPMVHNAGLDATKDLIPGTIFPRAYAAKQISAAVDYDEQSFLLFKGNTYLAVHKTTYKPLGSIQSWTGWPGFWKNDVDAALRWTDGTFVFIKGLQYVSYDPQSGETSKPAQLNRWPGWPSSWSGSIDAAFNGQDGFLYFIRQGEILAMDANTNGFVPGYPRKLAGAKRGVNLVGTDLLNGNNGGQDIQSDTPQGLSIKFGSWCSVGIPDAANAPDGGNITPIRTDVAGGPGGEEFSDKLVRGTRVKEVRVWALNMIQAIEIVTESQEKFITEGGPKGQALGSPKVFSLSPGECIIGIEGTWDGNSGPHVQTLRFITNKRKSQTFGDIGGRKGKTEFLFEVPPEGAFAGFHGRSSRYLDAIGIQYNIYQYVAWDADGNLLEATGNKTAWNSGTQTQLAEQQEQLKDPNDTWIDDHEDVDADVKFEGQFTYREMMGREMVCRSVDITKIDPWDLHSTNGRDQPGRSPFDIRLDKNTTAGPGRVYFMPHGYNGNKSGMLSVGRSQEKVVIMNTYAEYQREFGLNIGVEGGYKGIAGGTNDNFKERNTGSIGTSNVLASKTIDIFSHSCYVDLHWRKNGKNYRQKLDYDFREAVNKLPIPASRIPEIDIIDLEKNGKLPKGLDRYREPYDALIKNYGTHYMNNLVFGGWWTMYSMFSESEIRSKSLTEFDICAHFSAGTVSTPQPNGGSISVDGLTVNVYAGDQGGQGGGGGKKMGVAVQACMQQSNSQSSAYLQSESNIQVIASGGNTSTQNAASWETSVANNPKVRNAEFFAISDILDTVFFPSDEDIARKEAMLRLCIKQYIRDVVDKIEVDESIDGVEFATGAERDARMNELADTNKLVTVLIEFQAIRCDEDEGWGESDLKNLELSGNLSAVVYSTTEEEKEIESDFIYQARSDAPEKFRDENVYNEIDVNIKFSVLESELPNLRLYYIGGLKDHDTGGDDIILEFGSKMESRNHALNVPTQPGTWSNSETPHVLNSNKTCNVKYRVRWDE